MPTCGDWLENFIPRSKIKTKIICDLLAEVSRFLSPWLGFILQHTIGSFECQ